MNQSSLREGLFRRYHAHRRTFSRAMVTSVAATLVDYSTLLALVELAHVYYVIATACGAIFGAVTNFSLNRHWAFYHKGHESVRREAIRYALVSAGSLLLNVVGVFCFTEFAHLRYLTSKIVTSLLIGWFWNYPLHRYFVFKLKNPRS